MRKIFAKMGTKIITYKFIPYGLEKKTSKETYKQSIQRNNDFLNNQQAALVFCMTKSIINEPFSNQDGQESTILQEIKQILVFTG